MVPGSSVDEAVDLPAVEAVATKRLSINVTREVYDELNHLSRLRRSSMTEVVRLGLGLVRIAILEGKAGNKLIVTTADGKPVKEIVLP